VTANWARVDAVIEYHAAMALEEIHRSADAARDAIDVQLGFPRAFINRSRAQRRRYERQRALLEGGVL